MFLQLFFVLSFLRFSAATRYGASCKDDTSCDQHQKCSERICRCNREERRFWTGEYCAICARDYTLTHDRCFRSFQELKTWAAAREHCRAQYADLFTWRDNHDEIFIKPIFHSWATLPISVSFWNLYFSNIKKPTKQYLAWAGATVVSKSPPTIQWVDPTGMKVPESSGHWCDRTKHFGYESIVRHPSTEPRTLTNGTIENPNCVTYIFGHVNADLLCLATDFCSEKFPFICEMNAASMKLATQTHHGGSGNAAGGDPDADKVDFEEPPPPPIAENDFGNPFPEAPAALAEKQGLLSKTNMLIFGVVGCLLLVGAVAGYMFMQKKKNQSAGGTGASQGRPSFASSVGSEID